MWSYIESGKQEGAKVLVGGERCRGKGYFVFPTGETSPAEFENRGLRCSAYSLGEVFVDVKQEMKIVSKQWRWFKLASADEDLC